MIRQALEYENGKAFLCLYFIYHSVQLHLSLGVVCVYLKSQHFCWKKKKKSFAIRDMPDDVHKMHKVLTAIAIISILVS